jgi:hypothetical protein
LDTGWIVFQQAAASNTNQAHKKRHFRLIFGDDMGRGHINTPPVNAAIFVFSLSKWLF